MFYDCCIRKYFVILQIKCTFLSCVKLLINMVDKSSSFFTPTIYHRHTTYRTRVMFFFFFLLFFFYNFAHCFYLVLTQFKVLPHSWGLLHFCLLFQTNWIMMFMRSLMGDSYSSTNEICFAGMPKKEKNILNSKLKIECQPTDLIFE